MIENKPVPFENKDPIEVTCPKCGWKWYVTTRRYRITCPRTKPEKCGAWIVNPSAKYKPLR